MVKRLRLFIREIREIKEIREVREMVSSETLNSLNSLNSLYKFTLRLGYRRCRRHSLHPP